ncbi:hypothetical protein DUD61_002664 [Geotrichum candidum]|nr:hypothetical protein DUD61_002664 [Geotrichum candidum]
MASKPRNNMPEIPDITHLVDQRCFHTLPVYNPPQPFSMSPPEEIAGDLEALYRERFYKHAADLARRQIIETPVEQLRTGDLGLIRRVFDLWTVRQSALIMMRLASLAKEEAKYLDDLLSARYRIASTGQSVVPWKLKLLAVRVQAGGDSQAGIARYYSLARDARSELSAIRRQLRTEDLNEASRETLEAEARLWSDRLRNLGLYTSTMLVGTKDIKSALELLESMYDDCSNLGSVYPENVPFMGKVAFALGLLYLQIGDTISARQWFKNVEQDEVLRDLGISVCSIADLDWDTAESTLNKIDVSDTASSIPIAVKNNLAVTEIYKGRLNNALKILEELTEAGAITPTLLRNLSILYDLRQDIGKKAKTKLVYALKEQGIKALETYDFL